MDWKMLNRLQDIYDIIIISYWKLFKIKLNQIWRKLYVQHGNIFVISAPSGAGKSSLVKELCKLDNRIKTSISHTTRSTRPGEVNGIDYFFISLEEFNQMFKQGQFLECAKVYDNYYGTNLNTINNFLNTGDDIILEIDHQGAEQIKTLIPKAILIYIKPPSIQELAKRLKFRNTDSDNTIEHRLAMADEDMSHAYKFEYTIINNKFDVALQELYSIIMHHRSVNAIENKIN
jgi:guanylate kinase